MRSVISGSSGISSNVALTSTSDVPINKVVVADFASLIIVSPDTISHPENLYPSFAFAVTVTSVPSLPEVTDALAEPFPSLLTVTLYSLEGISSLKTHHSIL